MITAKGDINLQNMQMSHGNQMPCSDKKTTVETLTEHRLLSQTSPAKSHSNGSDRQKRIALKAQVKKSTRNKKNT